MFLTSIESSDLGKVGRAIFSPTWKTHSLRVSLAVYARLRGIAVYEKRNGKPIALMIFTHLGDSLIVGAFAARRNNLIAGQLLVSGLKELIDRMNVSNVFMLSEADARSDDFLKACGFELVAFFQADPIDKKSPVMEYRRLVSNRFEGSDLSLAAFRIG